MAGPLEGIKVIEWAHLHMGPGAGMFLADLGADVIHVEQVETGDGMRRVDTLWGIDYALPHGRNAFTEDLLRSKRSLSIDVRSPEGRDIVARLIADADVFLTNMRPKSVEAAGLDYETVRELNEHIVYCHGTAFGNEGPEKDSPGNEMMGLARSGMMLGSAPPGSDPVYPTAGINDRLGAIGMAFGILSALVHRERTGTGQRVDTSLLGWMVNLQVVAAQIAANTGQDPRPAPRKNANDPLYNYYQCQDGVWVALGMLGYGDRYWGRVCEALGDPDLAEHDQFREQEDREQHCTELIRILDGLFAKVTFTDFEARARDLDLIATKVNGLPDLASDPQVRANGYLEEREHPDLDRWIYAPTPVKFSETPVTVRGAAPAVGADTIQVLSELEFDPAVIEDLLGRRVVWDPSRV